MTRLNDIRNQHVALHEYDNLRFHWSASEQILAYSKRDLTSGDAILVVVNLDPFRTHDSMIYVAPGDILVDQQSPFVAHDLLSDERYQWQGGDHYICLDPATQPVHIFAFESE